MRPHTGLTEPVMAFLHTRKAPPLGVADNSLVIQAPGRKGTAIKLCFEDRCGWLSYALWSRENRMAYPTAEWTEATPRVFEVVNRVHSAGFYMATMEELVPATFPEYAKADIRRYKRSPELLANTPYFVMKGQAAAQALLFRVHRIFPDAHWDLGVNNWMRRRDGALVLNDPMSYATKDLPE